MTRQQIIGGLYLGALAISLTLALTLGIFAAWQSRQLRDAQVKGVDGADRASSAEIQADGYAATFEDLETYHRDRSAADDAVRDVTVQAERAPDADVPLDPDRLRRQRALDRELCWIQPTIPSCVAAAADAGSGADPVRPLPPAG